MAGLELLDLDASRAGYAAGVCNIGPAETARRRWIGIAGIGLAAVLAIALVAADVPPLGRLVVGLPLWGGLLSLLQARRHFCVGFAVAGIWNMGPVGDRQPVPDPAARAADLRRSAVMVGQAAIPAWLIALAFTALPI